MVVELINHFIEMSAIYNVEQIEENRYGGKLYFRFDYGNRKWSKEYKEPLYTYRIVEH